MKPETTPAGCPCSEAQDHVWDYLDGELTEQDCGRIREHLSTCESCARTFDTEQKMKDAVSRACGCDEAPQDLRSRVAALVEGLRRESCRRSQ